MRKNKALPELDYLRTRLAYNPDTGVITWVSGYFPGKEAGAFQSKGYRTVFIDNVQYQVSRVAWYLHTGEDPGEMFVDHIDRNKSNNRISNLRLLSNQENCNNVNGKGYRRYYNRWGAHLVMRDGSKSYVSAVCPLLARLLVVDHKKEEWNTEVPLMPELRQGMSLA